MRQAIWGIVVDACITWFFVGLLVWGPRLVEYWAGRSV